MCINTQSSDHNCGNVRVEMEEKEGSPDSAFCFIHIYPMLSCSVQSNRIESKPCTLCRYAMPVCDSLAMQCYAENTAQTYCIQRKA